MEWSVCRLLRGCTLAPCPDWETLHFARPLKSVALWVSMSGREIETVKQSYWHTCNKEHNYYEYRVHTFLSSFFYGWTDTPAYVLARLSSSVQACKSAKARIPRQLVGWSWVMRNSQQAFLTSCSCSKPAAGKSTWTHTHIHRKDLTNGFKTAFNHFVSCILYIYIFFLYDKKPLQKN